MSDAATAPQRVLVTGEAGGIGLAITRAFGAAGARVHLADPDADAVFAATAMAATVTGSVCDTTDAAAVTESPAGAIIVMSSLAGRFGYPTRVAYSTTERALDNQSIRRFTEAADRAALVVFLAGPHGRSISGQILPMDGDSKAAQ